MEFDAGDTPVGGVTIKATSQAPAAQMYTDVSASDGRYEIDLPSGTDTYRVEPSAGLPGGPGSVREPASGFHTIALTQSVIQRDDVDFLVGDCASTTTTTTSTSTSSTATTSSTTTTTSSTTTTTICVPTPENTPELCSDTIDNDCDTLIDCQDTDCAEVVSCKPIQRDPSRISFRVADGMDVFRSHGRVHLETPVDLAALELKWLVSNERGAVYRVSLIPGSLKVSPSRRHYSFRASTASAGVPAEPGPARVRLLAGSRGWVYYWITAYGDLSAATTPDMTLQFYLGDEPFILKGQWRQTPRGWILTRSELAPGTQHREQRELGDLGDP
jgi:hypothetical protein